MSLLIYLFIFCMFMVPLLWWYCRVKYLKSQEVYRESETYKRRVDEINAVFDEQTEGEEPHE